jgi:hypothetical protein
MKDVQIDRNNWLETILPEFPAFIDRWERHLDDWNPNIPRPFALDVSEFTDFAIETIETGVDTEIDRLTTIIECILVDGDSIVVYTFQTMLLAKIASRTSVVGFPIDRFTSKFQPLTAYHWQALDTRWGIDLSNHH